MIRKGEVYKYKEICIMMNEPVKSGGKSRQLQISNWKRYFEWENPTKQTYLITTIYDCPKEKIDGRRNNGGKRGKAGCKGKLDYEFNVIISNFIHALCNKNEYYKNNPFDDCVYFSNDNIYKFFGCYKDLYAASNDESVNNEAYLKISEKVREKSRSIIYNKIAKFEKLKLSDSVLCYKTRKGKYGELRDDLIDEYCNAEENFLQMNGYKLLSEVVNANRWQEMLEVIRKSSEKFDDYKRIKKMHKLSFDKFDISNININNDIYTKCQRKINDTFVSEIREYFKARAEPDEMDDYDYIINNYIKL